MVLAVKKQSSSSSSRLQYPLLMLLSTVIGPRPSLSSSGQRLYEGPFWFYAQVLVLVGHQAAPGQAACASFTGVSSPCIALGPLSPCTLLCSATSAVLRTVPACRLPAPCADKPPYTSLPVPFLYCSVQL